MLKARRAFILAALASAGVASGQPPTHAHVHADAHTHPLGSGVGVGVGFGRLAGSVATREQDDQAPRLLDPTPPPPAWWVTRAAPDDGAGRRWSGGTIIGGSAPDGSWPGSSRPGQRHGTPAHETRAVLVRDGAIVVAVDPFTPLTTNAEEHLERERVRWLRRHGYAGGVRTFVNPASPRQASPVATTASAAAPVPRAILRVPPAAPTSAPRRPAGVTPHVRLSLPPSLPPIMRAARPEPGDAAG